MTKINTKTTAKTSTSKKAGKPVKKASPVKRASPVEQKPVAAKKPTKRAYDKTRAHKRMQLTITGILAVNPYREETLGHKVFALYKPKMTVVEFFAAAEKALKPTKSPRKPGAFLTFDVKHGHVKLK